MMEESYEFRAVLEHGDMALGWAEFPAIRRGEEVALVKDAGAAALAWLINVPWGAVRGAQRAFDRYRTKIPEDGRFQRDGVFEYTGHEDVSYLDAVILVVLHTGTLEQRQMALGWIWEMLGCNEMLGHSVAIALRYAADLDEDSEVRAEAAELLDTWRDRVGLVPKRSAQELKRLVLDMLENRVFTSAHMSEYQQRDVGMVFMPIAMGALAVPEAALPFVPPLNRPLEPLEKEKPRYPPKPTKPKSPEPPSLLVPDPQHLEELAFRVRWDHEPPDAADKYRDQITEQNAKQAAEHQAELVRLEAEHQAELDRWEAACKQVDTEWSDQLARWKEEVAAWDADNVELLARHEERDRLEQERFQNFVRQIGIFYEYHSKSLPRSVNGMPMFTSVRLLHVDDWKRVWTAYDREMKRLEGLQI